MANIQIVLVEPQVPDNIGLIARVIKNTGVGSLVLVRPQALTQKAFEVAKRARDVLEKAVIVDTIAAALAESHFVFATTRRQPSGTFIFDFNESKQFIAAAACAKKISIVFGRENFGLTQEELEQCTNAFYIPARPDFPSYNLAAAVGIVCYELMSCLQQSYRLPKLALASRKECEELFSFLEKYLTTRIKKNRVQPSLHTLRRMFTRACLTKNEAGLLKSLFVDTQKP